MFRYFFSILIFIFAIVVFAQAPQQVDTNLTPPIRKTSPLVPLLGSQQAPSVNSTPGPGGRPNLEFVPMTTGSINSFSPSMLNPENRKKEDKRLRRSMRQIPEESTEGSATGPLPEKRE